MKKIVAVILCLNIMSSLYPMERSNLLKEAVKKALIELANETPAYDSPSYRALNPCDRYINKDYRSYNYNPTQFDISFLQELLNPNSYPQRIQFNQPSVFKTPSLPKINASQSSTNPITQNINTTTDTNQLENSIILDNQPIFIQKNLLDDLGSEGMFFTSKDPKEISQNIKKVNRKAQRFLNRNKKHGEHTQALYDLTTIFSSNAQTNLENGNIDGANTSLDLSSRFFLFGRSCIRGLKKLKKIRSKALVDSRDTASKNLDKVMMGPESVLRSLGEASNALSTGLGKLLCDPKNFTSDAKKVIGALAEKWDSLSTDDKLYHSIKLFFGIIWTSNSSLAAKAAKKADKAIKKFDNTIKIVVIKNWKLSKIFKNKPTPNLKKPIIDSFEKAVSKIAGKRKT